MRCALESCGFWSADKAFFQTTHFRAAEVLATTFCIAHSEALLGTCESLSSCTPPPGSCLTTGIHSSAWGDPLVVDPALTADGV